MTGTQKQIEFATAIRANFNNLLWHEVEEANQRVEIGDLPPVWAAAIYDATITLSDAVSRDADRSATAGFWIDNRARIFSYANRIKELAEKACPKSVYAGQALSEWRKELGLAD
jgi:hypothetical protein